MFQACSQHPALRLRREEHCRVTGRSKTLRRCTLSRRIRTMTPEVAPSRDSLSDSDPLPPDDRRTDDIWRADVEALYRDRADHLIHHFTSATADRDAASDVVHEAFARFTALSFARRLIVVRPDAYLYRICVNLIRDRGRMQNSKRRPEDRHSPPVDSHNPVAQLEHRDTLRRLETAMLRLKPKTREIFLAKRLDGMSYVEIAERTGLSVKGVEKHMSKAIAMIDRAMERDRP
jgi:RNA polymerase sigma factor (sigma-70 family)